ncbi:MAG: hypothetical protein KDA58_12835 [Planctomycetaceae bacterium]|nr:hypothetical protein [Planctomycetaceae bacterium]
MLLHNQPLRPTQLTTPCVLRRAAGDQLTLQLRPLPLGFHRRLRERNIVPPAPPLRVARDSNGRPIKDTQGHAVTLSDPHRPEYLAQLEAYHHRVAILSLAEALSDDPEIRFETLCPNDAANTTASDQWLAYADALAEELETAGFTAGDLIRLCQEICRLSNLFDDHIQTQAANFSSATPPDTD